MDKIVEINQIRDLNKSDYIIKKINEESFEKFVVIINNKDSEIIEIRKNKQNKYQTNLLGVYFDEVNIRNLKKDYEQLIIEGLWWK